MRIMVFNRYARYYDLFYRKKKYKRECEFLERIVWKYAPLPPKTILDLGCGTGGHMIPLAQRGYELSGVDRSGAMLKVAEGKFKKTGIKASLRKAQLSDFHLRKKFDVILSMFSVVDYLVRDKDLKGTLACVGRHMKSSSLFVFDFWNADAVERLYSPRKSQIFRFGDEVLERTSKTKIFPARRICEVNYTCHLREKNQIKETFQEKHVLRYFSLEEMTRLLKGAGFHVLAFCPFLKVEGKIRRNTWDVTAVVKKFDL